MYESKTYSALLQDALNEIRAGVQTGEGYLVIMRYLPLHMSLKRYIYSWITSWIRATQIPLTWKN